MEVVGKIKVIKEVKVISEKFSVQNVILDLSTYDRYTGELMENYCELQVNNDVIEKVKKLNVDDFVKADFYVKGRFIQKKETNEEMFIQNLICFKIELK